MSHLVLQLTLSPSCSDEEVMLLPFVQNLENESIYEWDYESNEEALELLTYKWKNKSWDYSSGTSFELKLIEAYTEEEAVEISKQLELFIREKEIELPRLPDDMTKTSTCAEFDIIGFDEFMIDSYFYSRPWEEDPNGDKFSCYHAVSCMEGAVYSKDYAFFYCECCQRDICEQNPSNGWHVQYRWASDCDRVCLKCYEEDLLINGVDLDEVLRTKTIPGMFFNSSELEAAGFEVVDGMSGVLVGCGYSGSQSEDVFFNGITERLDYLKDRIVIFEYDTMAIGGMGGYVTVWSKAKENDDNE